MLATVSTSEELADEIPDSDENVKTGDGGCVEFRTVYSQCVEDCPQATGETSISTFTPLARSPFILDQSET